MLFMFCRFEDSAGVITNHNPMKIKSCLFPQRAAQNILAMFELDSIPTGLY
jgi:hypothetical protein